MASRSALSREIPRPIFKANFESWTLDENIVFVALVSTAVKMHTLWDQTQYLFISIHSFQDVAGEKGNAPYFQHQVIYETVPMSFFRSYTYTISSSTGYEVLQ